MITLDIEMPRMDGLTFLQKDHEPAPDSGGDVLQPGGGRRAEHAEGVGIRGRRYHRQTAPGNPAVPGRIGHDAVSGGEGRGGGEVAASCRIAPCSPSLRRMSFCPAPPARCSRPPKRWWSSARRPAGPKRLRALLEVLPADSPGIMIVQHMPEMFTRAFANRLDGLCQISVKEAESNDTVLRGRALIAPGESSSAAQTKRRPLLRGDQRRPAGLPASSVGGRPVSLGGPLRRPQCGRSDPHRDG